MVARRLALAFSAASGVCLLQALAVQARAASLRGHPAHFHTQEACSGPEDESFIRRVSEFRTAKLNFIVHRKTGYVMSFGLANCFDNTTAKSARLIAPTLDGLSASPSKFVHMVRDPIDLAVSNFLYNKYTSNEPGTLVRGTAAIHLKRCKRNNRNVYNELPEKKDRETLRHWLHRVDNNTGLLETLCETMPNAHTMIDYGEWCHENKDKCMQVYLDEIMESSEKYVHTMKQIAKFAGFNWTSEVEHCLSFQDMNSPNFGTVGASHADHCSKIVVSRWKRTELKQQAAQLDAEYLDGKYERMRKALQELA